MPRALSTIKPEAYELEAGSVSNARVCVTLRVWAVAGSSDRSIIITGRSVLVHALLVVAAAACCEVALT
jgi:hypothetical protein